MNNVLNLAILFFVFHTIGRLTSSEPVGANMGNTSTIAMVLLLCLSIVIANLVDKVLQKNYVNSATYQRLSPEKVYIVMIMVLFTSSLYAANPLAKALLNWWA